MISNDKYSRLWLRGNHFNLEESGHVNNGSDDFRKSAGVYFVH